MQTITLKVSDAYVDNFMAFLQMLPKKAIQIEKTTHSLERKKIQSNIENALKDIESGKSKVVRVIEWKSFLISSLKILKLHSFPLSASGNADFKVGLHRSMFFYFRKHRFFPSASLFILFNRLKSALRVLVEPVSTGDFFWKIQTLRTKQPVKTSFTDSWKLQTPQAKHFYLISCGIITKRKS